MKRFTSLLLALLMAMTLLPAAAWAEETVPAEAQPATYDSDNALVERAKAAGYKAIEMGGPHDWITPDIFLMNAPLGLVEGTDYTCTFEDGHLTLKLLTGEVSHWKAALLNCVTSDTLGDTLKLDLSFHSAEGAVRGGMTTSDWVDTTEGFLNNNYGSLSESASFGHNLAIATPELNNSNTTICVEAGTRDYLYLLVWQNEAGEYTKYFLWVTIDGGGGINHEVATPVLCDLAADRAAVNSDVNGSLSSWNITTASGQLALTPKAENALSALVTKKYPGYYTMGTFAVTAPSGGYTLQSYYIIDQIMSVHYNFDSVEANAEKGFELFTSDNEKGGTLRYTLRWANADPTLPDLVEKLNVRVSPRPWGKLIDDGEADPSILDVERLFEYLTKEQKPVTGKDMVDPQLAAYDLNFDGYVDVYDIQALYEHVAYHSN